MRRSPYADPMSAAELDGHAGALLGRARIGMLALNSGRLPLVTPVAFYFGGSALWMTTSRHAVKVRIARRDPRAAFLVENEQRSILLQGLLEIFDPRTLRGPVRAMMEGPGFALNVAGYALKNAQFVAGYLLDLASIPGEWWPQNRVLLRLRVSRRSELQKPEVGPAMPARVPDVPAAVARGVARNRIAQLCWSLGGSPVLAPAMWAPDGSDLLAWVPVGAAALPREGARAALVVERHHSFRATRMLGACMRGRLTSEPGGAAALAERYGSEPREEGRYMRLEVERLTWWQGFEVQSARVEERVG